MDNISALFAEVYEESIFFYVEESTAYSALTSERQAAVAALEKDLAPAQRETLQAVITCLQKQILLAGGQSFLYGIRTGASL